MDTNRETGCFSLAECEIGMLVVLASNPPRGEPTRHPDRFGLPLEATSLAEAADGWR